MNINEVTLHAKRKFCERTRPAWTYVVDKVQQGTTLTPEEQNIFRSIKRTIVDIVLHKATLVSGLTKNNKKKARFEHNGLTYIVHFHHRKGKVITITWSNLY